MANACRWLARSLAVLNAVLVLAFAIGERSRSAVTVGQTILLGLFIAALVGNLAGWRWEAAGAALALLSGAAFAVVEVGRHGRLPGPWIIGVMILPALLYAASQILRRPTWGGWNGSMMFRSVRPSHAERARALPGDTGARPYGLAPCLLRLLGPLGHFVMQRKQLLGITRRAEYVAISAA